jgi:small conductance mechanosensitive channel
MDFNAQHLTHLADLAWVWAAQFLPRLGAAALILAVGFVAARWLSRAMNAALARAPQVDHTLHPLLVSVARYTVLILVAIVALRQIGFETSSLLAVVGAAGLAIGLALQGTLSNIAAGIMLLWLRPFHVGDFIDVAGRSGAVEQVSLFTTRLRTYDGLFLMMPNSAIWNTALTNYTRNGGRLVCINVAVPATVDLDQARQRLLEVAARTPSTLRDPPPVVFVDNVAAGAMVLTLRIWTEPQGAGAVARAIVEATKRSLETLGEKFTPTQIVRQTPPDTDPSRYLEGRAPVHAA